MAADILRFCTPYREAPCYQGSSAMLGTKQAVLVTQPQYDQTQPQSQYLSQTQPLPAYASVYPTAYPTAWYPPPPKFTPPPPPPALKNLFPTHSAHSAPIAARYASHTSLSHQHALTPRSKNLALIR